MKENICFVKFTNGFYRRASQYQICTKIAIEDGKKIVIKEALTPDAFEHIKKMYNNSITIQLPAPFIMPVCTLDNGRFIYDYIVGKTLNDIIMEQNPDKATLTNLLKHYVQLMRLAAAPCRLENSPQKFNEYFGQAINFPMEYCTFSNLDMTFENIIIANDKYYIIDNEWIFDFPLPFEYILFRALCNLYSSNTNLLNSEEIGIDYLFEIFHIDKYKTLFSEMEDSFLSNVYDYSPRSLKLLKHGFQYEASTLFVDSGNGFNESEKHVGTASLVHENTKDYLVYTFPLPPNSKALRWDPLEGLFCVVRISRVLADNQQLFARPLNAISKPNGDMFYSNDPQYIITGDFTGKSNLIIKAEIDLLTDEEVDSLKQLQNEQTVYFGQQIEIYQNEIRNVQDRYDSLQNKYDSLQNELESMHEANKSILNSTSWKITKPIRMLGLLKKR